MLNQDPIKKVEDLTKNLHSEMERRTSTVFERYPLLFSFLPAIGAISLFYGFEQLMNSIPLFRDNPWILIIVGIAILFLTGSLYKKLSH